MSTPFDKRDVAMRLAATSSMKLYWQLVDASIAADEMDDQTYLEMLSEAASSVHASTAFVRQHVEWLDKQPLRTRWNARRIYTEAIAKFAVDAVFGAFLAFVWVWLVTLVVAVLV